MERRRERRASYGMFIGERDNESLTDLRPMPAILGGKE
jgi:hypothetical protein